MPPAHFLREIVLVRHLSLSADGNGVFGAFQAFVNCPDLVEALLHRIAG